MSTTTENAASILSPLAEGTTVTLDLRGRGSWTGTVIKADSRGADLQGSRGAIVSVIPNKANPGLLGAIIGSRPRLHWVRKVS